MKLINRTMFRFRSGLLLLLEVFVAVAVVALICAMGGVRPVVAVAALICAMGGVRRPYLYRLRITLAMTKDIPNPASITLKRMEVSFVGVEVGCEKLGDSAGIEYIGGWNEVSCNGVSLPFTVH